MPRTRVWRPVVLIISAALACACSAGDPTPSPSPSPETARASSSSPTPTTGSPASPTPTISPRDKAIAEAKATVVEYVRLVDEASKNPNGSEIPDEIAKYLSEAQLENYQLLIATLEAKGIHLKSGRTQVVFVSIDNVSQDLKTVNLTACLDGSSLEFSNLDRSIFSEYTRSKWMLHQLPDGWILTESDGVAVKSCTS